jgi:DNA topoisomerase-3
MAIYGQEDHHADGPQDAQQAALVPVNQNETVATENVQVKPLETRPPPHFNEATLLSAMEGAGKLVDDEELRSAMEAKGLGTPATRAAIIEGLISEEYMRREGRELYSTPKAAALLSLLDAAKIPALSSPEMTGEWEYKLKQMEQGKLPRNIFMKEIVGLTQNIVERAKNFDEAGYESKQLDFKSPSGEPIYESLREYRTHDGTLHIRKVIGGRLLEPEELRVLLEKKFVGPLKGFRSKRGFPYSAALKLNEAGGAEFVFDNAPVGEDGEPLDLSHDEPVGICPVCQGRVFETAMSYACEHSFGDSVLCKVKIGKKILEQPIDRVQAAKVLSTGSTDLLRGFISNRTKKKFSAFLTLLEDGTTKFKFEEREEPADGAAPKKKWASRFQKPPATNAEVKATMDKKVAAKTVKKAPAKSTKKG